MNENANEVLRNESLYATIVQYQHGIHEEILEKLKKYEHTYNADFLMNIREECHKSEVWYRKEMHVMLDAIKESDLNTIKKLFAWRQFAMQTKYGYQHYQNRCFHKNIIK